MYEEKTPKTTNGLVMLVVITLLCLSGTAAFIYGIVLISKDYYISLGILLMVAGGLLGFIIAPIMYGGLKVLKPNEALVLTLFGHYYGTIKREGFYYVNPFVVSVNPAARYAVASTAAIEQAKNLPGNAANVSGSQLAAYTRKVSLKVMTLNNDRQKINDQLGNPIIIGIVVVWKVTNPTQAVFNVDNYKEYLSIQCDSALRNIVRLYPYDAFGDDNEKTLRGSSQEIAQKLKEEIQSKSDIAGLEILEARITHLSYAPEIAAVMLQRQQASAVIDARQMIVEGAVGMVEMALAKLSDKNIVALDDERKAAMVSNLLVVLCGNRDAQPVVNSGSIY